MSRNFRSCVIALAASWLPRIRTTGIPWSRSLAICLREKEARVEVRPVAVVEVADDQNERDLLFLRQPHEVFKRMAGRQTALRDRRTFIAPQPVHRTIQMNVGRVEELEHRVAWEVLLCSLLGTNIPDEAHARQGQEETRDPRSDYPGLTIDPRRKLSALNPPAPRVILLFEISLAGRSVDVEEGTMLTLYGPGAATCDGVSRRSFLKVGGMAMGGLSLPQLLQAEAASERKTRSHKSVIMVYLTGGISHQDTFDLKPDCPGRDPRRVQADRHEAARRSVLRASADDRVDDGQGRGDPLDRRPARRAFELSEHHRLPHGRQPSARASRTSARSSPGCKGLSTRSCRRSSTSSPSCSTSRTTPPARHARPLLSRSRGWMATTSPS